MISLSSRLLATDKETCGFQCRQRHGMMAGPRTGRRGASGGKGRGGFVKLQGQPEQQKPISSGNLKIGKKVKKYKDIVLPNPVINHIFKAGYCGTLEGWSCSCGCCLGCKLLVRMILTDAYLLATADYFSIIFQQLLYYNN